MGFRIIEPSELKQNPFTMIGKQWLLITAGNEQNGFNTMTASWGGVGVWWGKNAATIYIRPQRYTKEFVDKNELFTLSFLPESKRQALNICGSKSGRDCDKVKEAGLTPRFLDGTTAFDDAETIVICRKLLQTDFTPDNFVDRNLGESFYPNKDYHTMYIGEIGKVLVKE